MNGVKIQINQGDNLYAVVAKINNSEAAVKASVDPIRNSLNLATTDARQLWIEDVSGNTMNELGIIKDSSQQPPYNLNDGVRLSGGSMFDTVIAFRNALLAGDQESIGGRVIGSLDQGINSLVTRIAKSGAENERAQLNAVRTSKLALDVTSQISREGDLDFTKAITDMKMLDYTNQVLKTNEPNKFVFLHLECPHEPFVFLKNGSLPPAAERKNLYTKTLMLPNIKGYTNNIMYINNRALKLIKSIKNAKNNISPG